MDDYQIIQERGRQRYRLLATTLLGDERLRQSLDDEQAQVLQEWGLAQIKQMAEQTAVLEESDAMPILEKTETAVSEIIHLANQLMDTIGHEPDFDVIDDKMTRLFKTLHWLNNKRPSATSLAQVEGFNTAREAEDKTAAFHHLQTLIQTHGDSDEPVSKPNETAGESEEE